MSQRAERRRQALQTPRAAAVAGILFAVLFVISVGSMRLAIPEEIGGAMRTRGCKTTPGPSASP